MIKRTVEEANVAASEEQKKVRPSSRDAFMALLRDDAFNAWVEKVEKEKHETLRLKRVSHGQRDYYMRVYARTGDEDALERADAADQKYQTCCGILSPKIGYRKIFSDRR